MIHERLSTQQNYIMLEDLTHHSTCPEERFGASGHGAHSGGANEPWHWPHQGRSAKPAEQSDMSQSTGGLSYHVQCQITL